MVPWQVGCLYLRFFWTWHVLLLSTPSRVGTSCSIRGSPDGREGGRRENRNSRESVEKEGKKKERKEGRSELGEMMGGRERLEKERGSPDTGEKR